MNSEKHLKEEEYLEVKQLAKDIIQDPDNEKRAVGALAKLQPRKIDGFQQYAKHSNQQSGEGALVLLNSAKKELKEGPHLSTLRRRAELIKAAR